LRVDWQLHVVTKIKEEEEGGRSDQATDDGGGQSANSLVTRSASGACARPRLSYLMNADFHPNVAHTFAITFSSNVHPQNAADFPAAALRRTVLIKSSQEMRSRSLTKHRALDWVRVSSLHFAAQQQQIRERKEKRRSATLTSE
jgi:hypothetical protein